MQASGPENPISACPDNTAVITLSAPAPFTNVTFSPSSSKKPLLIAIYWGE